MSNIIPFPTKASQQDLYLKLTGFHSQMDTVYESIDKHHYALHNLVESAQNLETEYDIILAKYVDIVGADEVEVRMLQYSANAIVEVKADDGTFSIQWGYSEGDEEEEESPNDAS